MNKSLIENVLRVGEKEKKKEFKTVTSTNTSKNLVQGKSF